MESSRRAVESYWRSRMIDGATSDEDKVAPVYKLEEICELLRSSHVSIVKEVSEFVIKRLDHKSPIVKQKALRLIKYVVGKSGVEFRREMQRNSASVRQLIHYKGQLDALKGDALNKAVRTTAQEALSALFSTEDNKPAPAEDLTQRIQGFGNTNYEMPSEDRKSFISEVVGIGSATIMQGLNSLSHAPSLKKNDTGSYRSPNLRRSLTTETNYSDRYEGVEDHSVTRSASQFSKGGTWGNDTSDGNSSSSHVENKTREERLLETVVTSGGVRLQPTRDALQVFLVEASKLDALALSHALESKLQSHLWQVRVKAVCVLEAVLRKKDDDFFSIIESYFTENKDAVMKCSESPQASLREKANKVLTLLDGESTNGRAGHPEKLVKPETAVFQMPDLIDTGDNDDLSGNENSTKTTTTVDDLFGDSLGIGVNTREQKNDDDPFADVSFHVNNDKEHGADLFTGMTVDKTATAEFHMSTNKSEPEPELFDVFGSTPALPLEQAYNRKDVNDLMDGLSINENSSLVEPNGASLGGLSESIFSDSTTKPSHCNPNDVLSGILGSQATGINANPMFPSGPMAYNLPAGLMFNPAFASQQINYGALGNLFAQQQFMAATSNFQQMGNLHPQNPGVSTEGGGYSSPLPDIFNPSLPTQNPSPMMNSSKKEDTRAFDFISDHIQAARDPKRVI